MHVDCRTDSCPRSSRPGRVSTSFDTAVMIVTGLSLEISWAAQAEVNIISFPCQLTITYNLLALKYSDISGLEQSIDTAYQIASRRLFEVLFDKFKLLDHFSALKNYLMLGHGDFADQLMETLGYDGERTLPFKFLSPLFCSLPFSVQAFLVLQIPCTVTTWQPLWNLR